MTRVELAEVDGLLARAKVGGSLYELLARLRDTVLQRDRAERLARTYEVAGYIDPARWPAVTELLANAAPSDLPADPPDDVDWLTGEPVRNPVPDSVVAGLHKRVEDLRARRAIGHADGCYCKACVADRSILGAAGVLDRVGDRGK